MKVKVKQKKNGDFKVTCGDLSVQAEDEVTALNAALSNLHFRQYQISTAITTCHNRIHAAKLAAQTDD